MTTPTAGSGTVTIGGTVTLNGSTLNITPLSGFSGDQFTLIQNTGGSSVVGTFAGLAEGATLSISGMTYAITYVGGAGHDVVLNRLASIGGMVFGDTDNNGIRGSGETGVSGVTVSLYTSTNVLVATVSTDSAGNYLFTGLGAGNYYIKVTLPGTYASFSPEDQGSDDTVDSDVDSSGYSSTFSLSAYEHKTHVDAGVYALIGSIGSGPPLGP